MVAPRPPLRYPLFDLAGATSGLLPSVYQTSGIPPGSLGNSADMGALLRSTGLWTAYADCKGLRNADWLQSGTSDPVRLSSDRWAYPLASGLASLSPTGVPVFLYQGERLEVDFQVTQPDPQIRPGSAATSPISFAASRVTWIYMSDEGVVLLDVLPVASPANPPAGYFPAVGVTPDGFNVVSHAYTGSPARELVVDAIGLACTLFTRLLGGAAIGEDASDLLTVNATSTFLAAATFDALAVFDAQAVHNAQLQCLADFSALGPTATIGVSPADTLTIESTTLAKGPVTCAASAPLVTLGALIPNAGISLGAQVITGSATSRAILGAVDLLDQGIAADLTARRVQWADTNVMVGRRDGAAAQPMDVAARGYDVTFNTAAAINDTTAVCVRWIGKDEPVFIKITADYTITVAPAAINAEIKIVDTALSSVLVGVRQYTASAGAGKYEQFCRVYKWTPTDSYAPAGTDKYTFTARFGTNSGTITAESISIEVVSALLVT